MNTIKKTNLSSYTDENVVRLVALQVICVVAISWALFYYWGICLMCTLTLDFAIRAFTYLPSPLAFVGKKISKGLKLVPKPIFAPPKKFAATVGFVFSLIIALLMMLNFVKAAGIVSVVLVFFAFLESAFKICAGCYVYNVFIAPLINKKKQVSES